MAAVLGIALTAASSANAMEFKGSKNIPVVNGVAEIMMGATTTGGWTYMYVSSAAKLISDKNPNINVTPQITTGGGENLVRVAAGELPVGVASAAYIDKYYHGSGEIKPCPQLRTLYGSPNSTLSVIVAAGSPYKTIEDLKGKKVSICNIASGTPTNGVKPSMESTFHLGILRERPDVNVVLHFQSEYATAISCMKNKPTNFNVTAEIPCHVGSEIPVIPYYRPGSPELAKAVVEAMLEHNSVLLTNHGQVVCGKDFNQVYERATFFEMACRIIVQSGGDYSVLTPAEIEDLEIYVLGKKTK